MVHGRIEPSPDEQLLELRRSRDRYAALAERLHDDPELTLEEKLARELNARRIAHAYENSITNAVARMSSLGQTHRAVHFSFGMRAWLAIFVAISVVEGGVLLFHFHPEFFRLTPPGKSVAKVERIAAAAPAAPKFVPPPAAPPIAAPQSAAAAPASPVPKPAERPTPKPVAQPVPPVTPPRLSAAPPRLSPSVPPPISAAPKPVVQAAQAITPRRLTPPQLTLVAPPPVDAPPMPVIVLETPPASQSAPASTPITPPQVAAAPRQAQPPPTAQPAPPQVQVAATPTPATPTPAAPAATPQIAAIAPATPPPVAQPAAPPVATASVRPQTPSPTRVEAIAGTHTLPPYPEESKRLGESGTTHMQVAVSASGAATDCTVLKGSGSGRLDAAACSYVQARWRWKPATRDGEPVAANTLVTVVWGLKTGR